MPAPGKYPDELRQRAIRLVIEAREEDPKLSVTAAVDRVGQRTGVNPDTLRGWCKPADVDAGRRPGVTTEAAAELKALRQEVKELKRANEMDDRPGTLPSATHRPRSCIGDMHLVGKA